MLMRWALRTVLVLLALLAGTVTPVAAQEVAAAADSNVTEERLAAYAKAYMAITVARDSAHARFALSRNKTDQNQRELRDSLKQQIAAILQAHGFTLEQYGHITFVISRDEPRRKRFEELLAALAPKKEPR